MRGLAARCWISLALIVLIPSHADAQSSSLRSEHPIAPSPAKRWLIVCLDGVPLATMQSLWDSGHFREFARPTADVSSFPSDTETALTEALHAAPAPGYEHSYYDRAANRMRGGAQVTLSGTGIPYIRALDYDTPGWFKVVAYFAPSRTYRADLARFRKDFLASRAPIFLAHLATSDALLHVRTTEQAEPLLLEFDSALRDLVSGAHGELGVIIFSDHGNTETLSLPVPVESFLAKRGWRVRDSLDGARDVAIPAYGLVGFAALYCQPGSIEELAEDLRGMEGADVIISRHPGGTGATVRAAASGATAELVWSTGGRRYRYAASGGDPLALEAVFAELRAAGKLAADGSASDEDLFAATASASFPDSAARIRAWATNHVANPADVLVSLKPGYYHGAWLFQYFVTLVGTHGGLEKSASLGFAMASYPLAPYVRLADLLPANLVRNSGSSSPQ